MVFGEIEFYPKSGSKFMRAIFVVYVAAGLTLFFAVLSTATDIGRVYGRIKKLPCSNRRETTWTGCSAYRDGHLGFWL